MFPRPAVIAFLILAGLLLAFQAYGIIRLREPLPLSPDTALDIVCADLLRSANAKGLTGTAQEIERVSGPERDPYFDALAPFLNARLEHGFKRFLFSDDVRRNTVSRIERLMERREWGASPGNMTQATPDVLLMAEWRPLSGNDVGLTLRAVRLGVSGEGVMAATRFLHPRIIESERHQRAWWKRALYGSSVPLAALVLLSASHWISPRSAVGSSHGAAS